MTIEMLLEVLRLHQLKVGLVNDQVQVKSNSSGAIPSDVIILLRTHKSLLIHWLKQQKNTVPTRICRDGPLPLSYSQAQLWLADKMENAKATYNIFEAFCLKGELDKGVLIEALTQLVTRHEVLRTVYPSSEQQVIMEPPTPLPVSFHSFETMPEPSSLKALMTQEMEEHFDLESDFMLRAKVLSLPDKSHYLLLTTHHIASDGWSMDILRRELSELYRTAKHGLHSELHLLCLQVADLAHWQREQLHGEAMDGPLSYWKQQLEGVAPLHSIPLDFPREASSHGQGADIQKTLPTELSKKFKSYCSSRGVTPFMGMYSVFSLLLSHLSGERDIVLGTTIANRELPDSDSLIGYFVNSLVLRLTIPAKGAFDDLLKQSREVTLGAYAHQTLPFDRLVTELAPNRDPSYHPLFQVSINMVNTYRDPLQLDGLEVEEVELGVTSTPFDLILHIYDENDSYRLVWEYNTSLFREETIEGNHCYFEYLLSQIVYQENISLDALEQYEPPWKQEVILLGQGVSTPILAETYIDMWHQQVKTTPHNTAYLDHTQVLSYQDIECKAGHLAAGLIISGVKPENPVGIYLPRSVEMLVSILAIFKIGAYYVPLDHGGPSERNTYIVGDANIKHVLSRQSDSKHLPAELQIIDPSLVEDVPACTIASRHASNLAYVMYTSGSTGQPKGVQITQRGLVNYVQYCQSTYTHPQVSRALLHGPLTFDATLTSLFVPIVMGHHLKPAPINSELEFLSQELLRDSALIKITPAHLSALTHCLANGDSHDQAHVFVIGGENLTWETIKPWLQAFPNARFFNEYGPTESVVGCCIYEINSDNTLDSGSVPIGKPIHNTELFVVTGNRLTPPQQKGELCIAGPGVANGYLNRQALTSEKFTSLTLQEDQFIRVYRTGDIVAWQPGGELVYFGREDSQIKLNGYRIELGEIELSLQQQQAVNEAVVIIKDQTIVAYIQADRGTDQITEERLKTVLMQKLPHYMVPHRIVVLDKLLLTDNGKIDRNKLATLSYEHSISARVLPRNTAEESIYDLWTELLDLSVPVCIHDNFFSTGGHSLKAVQLAERVNQHFGVMMTPRDILINPTIGSMSQFVTDARVSDEWQPYTQLTFSFGLTNTYFIPGVCGHSAMFVEFADLLRQYTNGIVLEHKGLDGLQSPFCSYSSMLDTFVETIEATCLDDRVYLCGHSFGTLIVQDLAWLLEQKGYGIKVIMFDACFDDVGIEMKDASMQSLDKLVAQVYGMKKIIHSSLVSGFKSVYQQHQRFITEYQPLGSIRGPVLYLSAEKSPHSTLHSVRQWLNEWCCEFKLGTARGGHDSLLHGHNICHSLELVINFINIDLVPIKPNNFISKRSELQTLQAEASI